MGIDLTNVNNEDLEIVPLSDGNIIVDNSWLVWARKNKDFIIDIFFRFISYGKDSKFLTILPSAEGFITPLPPHLPNIDPAVMNTAMLKFAQEQAIYFLSNQLVLRSCDRDKGLNLNSVHESFNELVVAFCYPYYLIT